MKGIKSRLRRLTRTGHPLMRSIPQPLREKAWERIAVSPTHRFIYVRIPKAANSTISKTLASRVYPDKATRIAEEPTGNYAKGLFSNLWATRSLSRRGVLDRFFVFIFLRNPHTRLLSAYLDKFQSGFTEAKYQWAADVLGVTSPGDVAFPQFIELLENGWLFEDAHWAPQVALCPFPLDKVHYLGTIERLSEDLGMVMQRIFPEDEKWELCMRNHNRQNATDKIAAYYDRDLLARVHALYPEDFQAGCYEPDPLGA